MDHEVASLTIRRFLIFIFFLSFLRFILLLLERQIYREEDLLSNDSLRQDRYSLPREGGPGMYWSGSIRRHI